MALIHCPECRKEVSDQALSCPHCGYVFPKKSHHIEISGYEVIAKRIRPESKTAPLVLLILGAVLLASAVGIVLFVIGLVTYSQDSDEMSAKYEVVYYDEMSGRFVCYDAKNVRYEASISDFQANHSYTGDVLFYKKKRLGSICLDDYIKIKNIIDQE